MLGVAALAAVPACTESMDDSSDEPSVTYHRDVAPILARACSGCHQPGEIAPFSVDSYEAAAENASSIAAFTASGAMPPFYARETEECDPPGTWANDPRLSDDEIALLRTWADLGAPEGDPADSSSVGAAVSPKLDRVDVQLVRAAPSVVDGSKDLFQCVVFDPELTADAWIDGIHLEADNTRVAHHALTYKVLRADAAAASKGASVYECFGGAPGQLVHAWAPGGKPFDLPAGVGIPVGSDDVFVVQMHYHPTGEGPETDASALQLRLAPADPDWQLLVLLKGVAGDAAQGLLPGPADDGAPEFRIPAFAEGHVEEVSIPLYKDAPPGEAPLLFVAGHMHLVGRDVRVAITPSGGAEQCMLQVPSWDFSWQNFYEFDASIDELPKVRGDDTVGVRCTYDNTTSNPHLREALEGLGMSAPIDVRAGEGTLDEMCIAAFGVLLPADLAL